MCWIHDEIGVAVSVGLSIMLLMLAGYYRTTNAAETAIYDDIAGVGLVAIHST